MNAVEMHAHSHYSDGSDSPREVVRKAKEAGLMGICLTDHDSTHGLVEFLDALEEFQMEGLPGIELSSVFQGTVVHILGYGININMPYVLDTLFNKNWQALNSRIIQSLELYRKAGIMDISVEEMNKVVGAKGPAALKLWLRDYRVRFCNVSYNQAKAESKPGGLAFADYDRNLLLTAREAIHAIHILGGVPIWAHPGKLVTRDKFKFLELLKMFMKNGLYGMEVDHPENGPTTETLRLLANENDLFISAGSDYHGRFKPNISLGLKSITYSHFLKMQYDLQKIN